MSTGESARRGHAPVEGDPPTIDEYRALMGLFPTGVTVVTGMGPRGPAGMTVNAIASLSLDPILLMIGFGVSSRTLSAVRETGRFGVTVLARNQEGVSSLFASKLPERQKFSDVGYELVHGVPVLDGGVAWLVCDTQAYHPGGDHLLVVGRVVAMGPGHTDRAPLLFHRGRYRGLGGEDEAP
jgi:3-hydroxy-9,10-secoandrosta-1,3,5(10)-triene-9,17-dione monooxygenase reductase component